MYPTVLVLSKITYLNAKKKKIERKVECNRIVNRDVPPTAGMRTIGPRESAKPTRRWAIAHPNPINYFFVQVNREKKRFGI